MPSESMRTSAPIAASASRWKFARRALIPSPPTSGTRPCPKLCHSTGTHRIGRTRCTWWLLLSPWYGSAYWHGVGQHYVSELIDRAEGNFCALYVRGWLGGDGHHQADDGP